MLKKELMELCILHLLTSADRYGYETIAYLHDAFPDTQESAIYATLRGLFQEGCTTCYQVGAADGPARKYYNITPKGCEAYSALLSQWRETKKALASLGIQ